MHKDTPPPSPRHQVDATATPTGNLYADAMPSPGSERFETLLAHRNLVVERIVSSATLTPTAYVQAQDEWVALLHGEATLDVAGTAVPLRAGDHLFLPAGVPHSVLQVSEGALWLAVHLHPSTGPEPPTDELARDRPERAHHRVPAARVLAKAACGRRPPGEA